MDLGRLFGLAASVGKKALDSLCVPSKPVKKEHVTSCGVRVNAEKGVSGGSAKDIDLRELDRLVQEVLKNSEKEELTKLEEELEKQKTRLNTPGLSIGETRACIQMIKSLKEEIELTRDNVALREYITRMDNYVKRYTNLSDRQPAKFGEVGRGDDEKLDIVRAYLRDLELFFLPVDLDLESPRGLTCVACGTKLGPDNMIDSRFVQCPGCGSVCVQTCAEVGTPDLGSEGDRADPLVLFNTALAQIEGTTQLSLDLEQLRPDLDSYFGAKEIRLRRSGERDIVTDREALYEALGEIGGTHKKQLLENVNQVGRWYWNWTLPKLTPHRAALYADFVELYNIFPHHSEGRSTAFNPTWVMWKLCTDRLQLTPLEQLSFSQVMFKTSQSKDGQLLCEKIYANSAKELGWI